MDGDVLLVLVQRWSRGITLDEAPHGDRDAFVEVYLDVLQ